MALCQTEVCGCDSLQKSLINTVLHATPGLVKRRYDANPMRLQQSWRSYMTHPVTFTDVCERAVYLLYRYSLQVVLNPSWQPTGRWSKSLKVELSNLYLTTSLVTVNKLSYRLQYIVSKPWKRQLLMSIIYPGVKEQNGNRVARHFKDEGETMIWTRLEVLCETPSVIEKIVQYSPRYRIMGDRFSPALSYATAILRYLTSKGKFRETVQNIDVFRAGCPLDFRDAFLALLAREGKIDTLRNYMYKSMSLHAVSSMRERIRNWPGRLPPSLAYQASTVDFHASEVSAGLALSQGRMGRQFPMLKKVGWELAVGHTDSAACSKAVTRRTSALVERARRLASAGGQPIDMFTLAKKLSRMKMCPEYRNICLELYLMGLKLELSRRTDAKRAGTTNKMEVTMNTIIASVFGKLAKLFNTQWLVKRELLLTAFSLRPNKQLFNELLFVARQSGKTCTARGCTLPIFDSWCPDTAAHALCSKCGRFGTHGNVHSSSDLGSLVWFPLPEHVTDNTLADPPRCHMLDNKSLGIERNHAEQLVSLVSAFRYKELSWVLEWSKLYTLCDEYKKSKNNGPKKNGDLIFVKMDYPLYRCLQEDNKIVGVKRKRIDEDCTDFDNERLNYKCEQETKKMNINTYCLYKTKIDAIDNFLSSININPFSSEVCDMFDVEDTATGFSRLCEIRRAMVNLYEKNTEDMFSYFKRKVIESREKYETSVQDYVAC